MNYTLKEAMSTIESHEFSAYVNAASGMRTFLQAVNQHNTTRKLLKELEDPIFCLQILNRVFELSRQQVDPRYENPWDTALAVYVLLLSWKDESLAKIAAEEVIHIPQCWWAMKVSRRILLEEKSHNDAGFTQYEFSPKISGVITTQTSNSGEVMFIPGRRLGAAKEEANTVFGKQIVFMTNSTDTYEYTWGERPKYIVDNMESGRFSRKARAKEA